MAAKPAEAKPPEAKPAATKPAEAKPAEAKPAETKPAETPSAGGKGPVASYALLARPSYAERLKLTDEQRTKVTALLAERADALAEASESRRGGPRRAETKAGRVAHGTAAGRMGEDPPPSRSCVSISATKNG